MASEVAGSPSGSGKGVCMGMEQDGAWALGRWGAYLENHSRV